MCIRDRTPPEQLALWAAWAGIHHEMEKLEASATSELSYQGGAAHPMADAPAAADHISHWVIVRNGGEACRQLATLTAGLVALEKSPLLAIARERLDPLTAERDRLRLCIKADTDELARHHQHLVDVERMATEAAIAKAHASGPVVAARRALLDAGGTLPGEATTAPAETLRDRFFGNGLGELA